MHTPLPPLKHKSFNLQTGKKAIENATRQSSANQTQQPQQQNQGDVSKGAKLWWYTRGHKKRVASAEAKPSVVGHLSNRGGDRLRSLASTATKHLANTEVWQVVWRQSSKNVRERVRE